MAINGNTIKVRITYASSSAPHGYLEGMNISVSRDAIKEMGSVSIDAAIRGNK